MPKPSNRDRILKAGLKVMFDKGYVGAGVRDIVAEASAPQGSFTNHFRSKEDFAREVLDLYFDHTKGLVAEALDDPDLAPATASDVSRHHHGPSRQGRVHPRLPDRRFQPRSRATKRDVADAARRGFFRMARALRRVHCGRPSDGRDRR